MVSSHRFGRFASLSLLLGVACAGALAGPPTASSPASPTTQHVYIPPDQAAIKLDKAGKVDADFISKLAKEGDHELGSLGCDRTAVLGLHGLSKTQ